MLVIPAIDLREGRCVRLRQGKIEEETEYSVRPEEVASRWVREGAERIHIVDLDGARAGRPVNEEVVRKIAKKTSVPVQVGGGIRSMKTLKTYMDEGVQYVILGTSAYKEPGLLKRACSAFPGRIFVGIDARQGQVSLEGWTEEANLSPLEWVRDLETLGVGAVIYTDVLRDGTGSGPNLEGTRLLARATSIPVIASGGIRDLSHVLELLKLEGDGIVGMVTGRALYEGTLDLREALGACSVRKKKTKSS